VPAGNPDGGQWTDGGSVIRVQNRPRSLGGGMRRIAGRQVDITPAQATRLEISHAQMQAAVRRVRELEPRWKPIPSAYETVEGEIAANNAAARQALDRLAVLQRRGIGPGPYAVESQPARGPGRRWTAEEIRENNRIGRKYGCHTCGTKDPGTPNGNFIGDHQHPNALNPLGRAQRIYPHCLACMKTKKYAPENSIVFISDNLQSMPPEHVWGNMINYNSTCVSVGCYPEIDGETEFQLGRAREVSTDFDPVFDGTIETPNRMLMISTVEGTILLEDTVSDLETRVRVWLSHPRWPEKVIVGWG